MKFDLESLIRPAVRDLEPYSSARSEFDGAGEIFLDANENSFGSPFGEGLNRYPDPLQSEVKLGVSDMLRVDVSQLFVGNGSDEAIDLLLRIFCRPGRDEILICPPTYGMYSVLAQLNEVAVTEVPLTAEFHLDVGAILKIISEATKMVFICSPNNPTGNSMRPDSIIAIAERFGGIVVVDEAYIQFSRDKSAIGMLSRFPNLVVLQTFSKAWGLAGARVGLAISSKAIVDLLTRVKPPYNVSSLAQTAVLRALEQGSVVSRWNEKTSRERDRLAQAITRCNVVRQVYPSDSNFLLVKVTNAPELYRFLIGKRIVVRDRSSLPGCENCIRITVGTPTENEQLIEAINQFSKPDLSPITL